MAKDIIKYLTLIICTAMICATAYIIFYHPVKFMMIDNQVPVTYNWKTGETKFLLKNEVTKELQWHTAPQQ